ncbi:hypothetical protein CEUSTIGMA_g3039.t1 [Chlamydomonas eustigma]|uniref:DNA ligase n=1 Tax=Chlamydomonas eustigma TaxID=1157962 RepID=A0A250WXT5_9CHLO|nr:hypothetical protein CEUSTIGMA_g3039.t1 [Chlamydomonas eustigma]|eukprot:GAX75595.1 hypothetical protein CEUSTIGMA_g3039.t1 [Chlamydomonas eustigma]
MPQKTLSAFYGKPKSSPNAAALRESAPNPLVPINVNFIAEKVKKQGREDEAVQQKKRRRLARVVEDSPSNNTIKEGDDLEDDVEGVILNEKSKTWAESESEAVHCSIEETCPAIAGGVEDGVKNQNTWVAVASSKMSSIPQLESFSEAPKKVASIFMKPKPKSPRAPANKSTSAASKPDQNEGEAGQDAGVEPIVRIEAEENVASPSSVTAAEKRVKADVGKVEGVGLGALAAASKHAAVDVDSVVGGRWDKDQPIPFEFLADTFEEISETSKRLDIVNLLINCFRAILTTTPEDLLPAIYLCTNRVAPAHYGVELGIGEGILFKALSTATGRSEQRIKDALKQEGDLGIVAVKLKSTQKTFGAGSKLTVRGVFKAFKDIATSSGKNSQKVKEGSIVKMLASSKGNETGYVIRSLQAKLRIGLAEQSVLTALAHSFYLWREGARDKDGRLADKLEQASQLVKQAYSECPSYDVMIPALLSHPMEELLQHCHFMPGVPVKPMLAKATNAVTEVIDKFQDSEFTCEYKYDGERAQLHVLEDGTVMIFSRNSENNSSKYPDIVQRVHKALRSDVKSIVLDTEAVAYDRDKKKILPFQVLSTRKRKDVAVGDIDVQVCVFAFDCLYINGRSLLKCPLEERRAALYSAMQEMEGEMQFATAKTSKDVEELQRFLDEAVDGCTEGLIVKTLCDTYEPAKRSSHWLKLKKDYLQGVGDTIDVVPIGAFHGKGKRTGVFGAYLLSIYDPETETYQTISKLGTGFSEEVLQQLADCMTPHIIDKPKKYYTWGETLVPDVWFDTVKVWEVKAADLSISPVHKAGLGLVDPVKGISIRFPRLIRVRDDKAPEDATSAEQIADMFRKQAYHKTEDVKEQDEEDGQEDE